MAMTNSGTALHTVERMVTLDSEIEEVWKLIRDFGAHSAWLAFDDDIAGTRFVTGDTTTPGSERGIKYETGLTIRERLVAVSDIDHELRYSLVESPLPISDHEATLRVEVVEDLVRVIWRAQFQADQDTANLCETMMGDNAFAPGLEGLRRYVSRGGPVLSDGVSD